jgi:SsrA-binding protein
MSGKSEEKSGIKVVALNKKARFDFHILEKFEAGLVLSGAEIKSVRNGAISLAESYIAPSRGELFLVGAHIKPYAFNADPDYDPVRRRKLLMHKREITKLAKGVEAKGCTIVPLQVYLKRGFAKLEIGLAKGKAAPDKRQNIKEREAKREMGRIMKGGRG